MIVGLTSELLLAVLFAFVAGAFLSRLWFAKRFRPSRKQLETLSESLVDFQKGPVSEQQFSAQSVELSHLIEVVKSEVQNLQERHELMTTNIAASVVIRDAHGKIVFCSPYTQVLTGYSADDVYSYNGDFFESIVVDEDIERYQRARQVGELGEDILVRYRILHRSGLKLWLETRIVPVVDERGDIVSIMAVTIDVTDTLTYQRQIEEQNRDLSDFAYMVSHDLKAPIFTIKGMASAMVEDYSETIGKDGTELLSFILDGTDRLEQLVASVIEYSAVATKDSQDSDVDLNTVLASVRADLAENIREKSAEIDIEENLPTVRGDQIRIYQVFSNLLGNALKYSNPSRAPQIQIKTRWAGEDSVIIDVTDNGLGIPAGKLDDIFRPYHRAHGNDIEGSGIGLACVKKIVERLGGSVSVQSSETVGSTFTVEFPSPLPMPQAIPEDLARLF